jgi:radical SAM superfamily enzyme YgiQ (UPF0313 family)
MRLYLVNPDNPVVSLTKLQWSRLNRYRVWKPLSLLVLASLTPDDWQVEVLDENLGPIDYTKLPRPDLVGVTAFTSQATRAYRVAATFRTMGVPVVMGGIHASMCLDEALAYVDTVVTGEAESVWRHVLDDARDGRLQRVYKGGQGAMEDVPAARHEIGAGRYYMGSIQTTRGCPLNCSFCSVTAFNGGKFRHRPIADVVAELKLIRESRIAFVDDNLVGTRHDHVGWAKELFRAMIAAEETRPWICQATINFADDDELMDLAARAGCEAVLFGFESPTLEGLVAVHKKFNVHGGRDLAASVRRVQGHGILVLGSFIMGLDTDGPGIGTATARAAEAYGVDMASVLFMTPLPGTELYREMERDGRIAANRYPDDWQYYTLGYPVARYRNFTWDALVREMDDFNRAFYSVAAIARRTLRIAVRSRSPLRGLISFIPNWGYRSSHIFHQRIYAKRTEPPVGAAQALDATPAAPPMRR